MLIAAWSATIESVSDIHKLQDFVTDAFDDLTVDWDANLKQIMESTLSTAMERASQRLLPAPLPPAALPVAPSAAPAPSQAAPEVPTSQDDAAGHPTKLGRFTTPRGNAIEVINDVGADMCCKGSFGEVDMRHLARLMANENMKNRKWFVQHIRRKDFTDWGSDDLERMAAQSKLDGHFMLAADGRDIYAIVDMSKNSRANTKDLLVVPEGTQFDKDRYRFNVGGNYSMKLVQTIHSIWDACKLIYGTIRIESAVVQSFSFAQCMETVKAMDFDSWNEHIANIEYKAKKKTATDLEDAVFIMKGRIEKFLQMIWQSRGCVKLVGELGDDTTVKEISDLPRAILDLPCYYWNDVDNTISTITLDNFFQDSLSMNRSIILAGDAGAFKSTSLHALLRIHTVVCGCTYYTVVQDLDHFGGLTVQGKMEDAGAYAADDVNLTSRNGVAMSVNEIKQLFEVTRDSAIGCRYRSAQFIGRKLKMFAVQWQDNITHVTDIDSFQSKLPFLQDILDQNIQRFTTLSEDNKAIARRVVICRMRRDSSLDDLRAAMVTSCEQEMAARNNARAQLLAKLRA